MIGCWIFVVLTRIHYYSLLTFSCDRYLHVLNSAGIRTLRPRHVCPVHVRGVCVEPTRLSSVVRLGSALEIGISVQSKADRCVRSDIRLCLGVLEAGIDVDVETLTHERNVRLFPYQCHDGRSEIADGRVSSGVYMRPS